MEKNKIVISLLSIGAFLVRTGNRLISDFDINQQQFSVLAEIKYREPVCQKDICSQLLHEKSNVSKIVKKLVGHNFIEKTYSENDNRITLLRATKKGQRVIDQCMKRYNDWNSDWLKFLSREEVKQAVDILEKLKRMR